MNKQIQEEIKEQELEDATKWFAEEIKKCRLKLGESQTVFAKRFGVATNTISRYETGHYQASYEIILWVLIENNTIKDTSPASLDHANLAIDHLQKVIEELNKEKAQAIKTERNRIVEIVEKLKGKKTGWSTYEDETDFYDSVLDDVIKALENNER